MKVSNHKLDGAPYQASPNRSGAITPKGIVYHYTAGISASGAVSWLSTKGSRASAHLVIGEDGSITQLVPFNIKAWHAGRSKHPVTGLTDLNSHYIGFEISNPGPLKKIGSGRYQNWDGSIKFTEGEGYLKGKELIEMPHPRIGGGTFYWPEYTEAQLKAVEDATVAVLNAYPTVTDAISHEVIDTRGWKTDPGPAFPMGRMWRLFGRKDGYEGHLGQDYYLDEEPDGATVPPVVEPEDEPTSPPEAVYRWRLAEIRDIATEALESPRPRS